MVEAEQEALVVPREAAFPGFRAVAGKPAMGRFWTVAHSAASGSRRAADEFSDGAGVGVVGAERGAGGGSRPRSKRVPKMVGSMARQSMSAAARCRALRSAAVRGTSMVLNRPPLNQGCRGRRSRRPFLCMAVNSFSMRRAALSASCRRWRAGR